MLEKGLEANTKATRKSVLSFTLSRKQSLHIWRRTNAKETRYSHKNDAETMGLIEKSIACSRGFYFLIFSLTYCEVENSILNQLEQYQRNV